MKTFQSLALCFVLLCGATVLVAQAPYWQWAVKAGGDGKDWSMSIATDSQENQYVTGHFEGTATFGTHTLTANGGQLGVDLFVAKLDPNGNWLWAVKAGGIGNEIGNDIAVDGAGNAYVTGFFKGTATFGTHTLTASGEEDIFIAKLDTSGNWLWAVKAGGTGDELGYGIALDGSGNAWVTGMFEGTATFGSQTLTSRGDSDIFAAKLDTSGNWIWAVRAGGTNLDMGLDIAVDIAGNAWVTGNYISLASFGSHTLTELGGFVAKLDPNGNWLWAVRAGHDGRGVVIDTVAGLGAAYVVGEFESTATFGSQTLTSSGMRDVYVAKLNPNGNWLWAVKAGGTGDERGYGIAVDGVGKAYVIGEFRNTATFGVHVLTSSGEWDIFAAKLDSFGNWLWAVEAGGTFNDYGYGIAVDGIGNAYLTGKIEGTTTFGTHILTANGFGDVYVAKISYIDEDAPPKAPENVHITLSENSALITWDAVTENILGQPITPDCYYVYKSSDPFGQFTYYGSSSDTTFVLSTTDLSHPRMFYRVTAYKDNPRGRFDPASPELESGKAEAEMKHRLEFTKE